MKQEASDFSQRWFTQQNVAKENLNLQQAKGLLDIINNYTQTFILLNQFDSNNLTTDKLNQNISYIIDYNEAFIAIDELKNQLINKQEASELFGQQKDNNFQGILGNIGQSFAGEYLYPSIEEQAAHLIEYAAGKNLHILFKQVQGMLHYTLKLLKCSL